MLIEAPVLRDSGEIVLIPLAEDVVRAARLLPDEPNRYFLIDESSTMLPILALLQTRSRADGIQRAVKLLRRAYEGTQARREPISVERWRDGRYLVRDGNSTTAVARAAGWALIPCLIEK
jgi:hypothetical protein